MSGEGSLSVLRLLVLSAVASAFVCGLQFWPIHDVDIFWQVRLGVLTIERGGLLPNEPFLAGRENEPLVPVAWLAQVVYAAVYEIGGWWLLHRLDILVYVGGLLAAALSVRRSEAGPIALGAALVLGFVTALPNASLRPQSWAVLGFGLFLVLLRRCESARQKLLLAVPLLLVWQNAHPSISMAAVVAGCWAGVGWVRFLAARSRPKPWAETALVFLCAAMTFATPAGTELLRITADNSRICKRYGVAEWVPLADWGWDEAAVQGRICIAVALLVLLRGGRRARAEDVAVAAVFLLLTRYVAYRFSLFFGLALIPVAARCLARRECGVGSAECGMKDFPEPAAGAPRRLRSFSIPHSAFRTPHFLGASLAFPALALLVPLVFRPPLFESFLPFEAMAKLRESGVRGTIYCSTLWGGPLGYAGYPDWKVTIDGRYYLFSVRQLDRYYAEGAGDVPLEEIERNCRPAAFFLQRGTQEGLIARLRAEPGRWEEIYADDGAVVFVPSRR